MSVLIRRITLAALLAAFVGGSLALPASSKTGPVTSVSKCKKTKKGKHKKKKKKCGGGSQSSTLPGQATHSTPTLPAQQPPASAVGMSAIGVTDNPILGGNPTSGQVTINGAAPSGGQSVTLQSSDPSRAAVPATLIVPAGQTTASFPVTTTDGATIPVTLTASIGTSVVNTQLNVVSDPSVASVTLERQCFTPGGPFNLNSATLDVPAPANTVVDLGTDSPSSLSVPSTVTVPAGSKSAFFALSVLPAATAAATVTATLGTSSAHDAARVSLTPPDPAVMGLSLNPSSVSVGGTSVGTVTLDCEVPPGGATVTLQSSDPSVATVPSSVNVLQDQLSKTFNITVVGFGDTIITATGPSGLPKTATLHVDSEIN
jgi:trimeric autotransporter adhesin